MGIGSGVVWGFGVGLWGVVRRSAVGVALRRCVIPCPLFAGLYRSVLPLPCCGGVVLLCPCKAVNACLSVFW